MDGPRVDRIARALGRANRRQAMRAAIVFAMTFALASASAPAPAGVEAGRKKPRRCGAGKKRCGKACVDLRSNRANCGTCGNSCKTGWGCQQGVCCRDGEANCGGACKPACNPGPNPGPNPIPNPGGAIRPFPQMVSYPGKACSLTHRTAEQQAGDVRAAYDRWKANYFRRWGSDAAGNPLNWIVYNRAKDETVSEAMGFGMLIVATMAGHDPDACAMFDGLWRFALAHPSCNDRRLMTWRVNAGGDALGGCSSAFDGDADMAYALLLAEAQWGNSGSIDYRAAFDLLIAGIEASTIGPQSRLPMMGDWVSPAGSQGYDQWCFRTSDVMPGHFRAFAAATGRSLWTAAVAQSQAGIERLQTVYATQTGLLPDFAQPLSGADHRARPANPGFLEGPTDDDYNYNAGRDPWRIGTDALMANDAVSRSQALRLAIWSRTATGGDPATLRSGYMLDGTPLSNSDYFSSFFAAPFGVAAMTDPAGGAWLRAVYDGVRDAEEGYYEDSVALLSLLVMTGNFWSPA